MIFLSLDTSHSEGSLCLQRDSSQLEEFHWTQEKSHAELVAGFISKALKNHNLDVSSIDTFVVNSGPGSFTGIRISINTIKTLAYVTKKPILTFNSLETIAQSCSHDQDRLVVAINAHSELCYTAEFIWKNSSWTENSPIEVISANALNEKLEAENTIFVGDAFEVYKDRIQKKILYPTQHKNIPSAKSLCELALKTQKPTITWEQLEPFYVRRSSPEEKNLMKS